MKENTYRRNENYRNVGFGNDVEALLKYVDSGTGDLVELVELFRQGGYINNLVMEEDRSTKPHQIRKFYDYLLSILMNLMNSPFSSGQKDYIKTARFRLIRMVPMVKYSSTRGLLGKGYENFISKSAEAVSRKEDTEFRVALERFKDVYEAIVAYSKKG
jgi:CRISPR type III-A-associated protein Csm2